MNVKVTGIGFLLLFCATVASAAEPSWFQKTIIPEGNFAYAVGHSNPQASEQEVRDEALSSATREFVRHCKVSVDSFDRSISKSKGREYAAADFKTQNTVHARAFVSQTIPEDWYIRSEKGGMFS